ncbi:hypothetical protein [Niveispirillum fermenti]|uniref:hypothetical protein n=1 Tax=Niveispirillum fermenti TaxID=1233113 RepID=UPI003A858498
MRHMLRGLSLAVTILASPPLAAGEAADCAGGTVPPPPELAAWTAPAQGGLPAAVTVADAPAVMIGTAVELALRPSGTVDFPVTPGRDGKPESHAGLLTLDIARAGTYRVALGSAAWVDIVRDGASIASVAHGHGPACTGIRKIVDFPLAAGRHVLMIAASPVDRVTALVVPGP